MLKERTLTWKKTHDAADHVFYVSYVYEHMLSSIENMLNQIQRSTNHTLQT